MGTGAVTRLFLIAGEASGDALGAGLIDGLRQLRPDVAVAGVGGEAMRAAGLDSLFPMSDLSVMGLAEVLHRLPHLLARARQTTEAALAFAPDALISIDSPDFGLRVAARVRRRAPAVRLVHYVAPTVWAWRPGRARVLARRIDQLLALYPFEPPWFTRHGLRCDFVGHPAAVAPRAGPGEVARFRNGEGLGEGPLLVILPGSRAGEVARLAPRFGAALALLRARHPGLQARVVAAPAVAGAVKRAVAGWPAPAGVVDLSALSPAGAEATRRAAYAAGDVALAASGTVSLELARQGTVMVIGYDTNALTRLIARRMLRTDTVTLVNLLSESRAVPEFLGTECRPAALATAIDRLLSDPAAREAQHGACRAAMARLGEGGDAPGLRAARAVLDGLGAMPDGQGGRPTASRMNS